jgi:hypothetical protein
MKKFILLLAMLPTMSFAQNFSSGDFDLPGTPVSDEELSQVGGDSNPAKCAKNSDMYCFGKRALSVCVTEPQPPVGRTGICRPRGAVDSNNEVTCYCR